MRISKNYAIDCEVLRKWKSLKYGLTFFDAYLDTYFEGDHAPQISFVLIILNIKLIDFTLYNIHHENFPL